MLDAQARRASKRLAAKLGVSPSEVMRRALQLLQAEVLGVPERSSRRSCSAGRLQPVVPPTSPSRPTPSRRAVLLTHNPRDYAGIEGLTIG